MYYLRGDKMKKVIEIEGMKCTGCENAIENALRKMDGIVDVKADYRKGRTVVEYDENNVTMHEIVEKIMSLRYKVKM